MNGAKYTLTLEEVQQSTVFDKKWRDDWESFDKQSEKEYFAAETGHVKDNDGGATGHCDGWITAAQARLECANVTALSFLP